MKEAFAWFFRNTFIWRQCDARMRLGAVNFNGRKKGGEAGEQNIRNKTLIRHCDGGNAKSRAAANARQQPSKPASERASSQRLVKNRDGPGCLSRPRAVTWLYICNIFSPELHLDWRARLFLANLIVLCLSYGRARSQKIRTLRVGYGSFLPSRLDQ